MKNGSFEWALEQMKAQKFLQRRVIKNDTVIIIYKKRLYQMSLKTGVRYPYSPSNSDLLAEDWMAIEPRQSVVKFEKRDKVRHDNKIYECIMVDGDNVLFGEVTHYLPYEKEKSVSYEKTFVINQEIQDLSDYEDCVGICEHSGLYVFENDEYDYDPDQNTYFLKVTD